MAAAALRFSAALRLVLNGYAVRPQHHARAFCKAPPDDAKPVEEVKESLTKKQQENGDKVIILQRPEDSLIDEKLQQSTQKCKETSMKDRPQALEKDKESLTTLQKPEDTLIDEKLQQNTKKCEETPMKDRPQAFENDKEEKPEQSYDKKIIFQVNHDHHTNEKQASQMGELPVTKGKHDINTDFSCNEKQVRSEDELPIPQDVTMSASKEEQVVKEHSSVEKSDDRRVTAQKKLHDLLTSLASADPIPVEPMVRLSRPKARQKKTGTFKEQKKATEQPTESVIEPELVLATKEVAESLGGDVETTESELLSTLRLHSTSTSCDDKPAIQLSDLFVGMKVERNPRKPVRDLPRHKRYDQDTQQSSPRGGVEYQKMWPRATGRPVPRTLARVELFGTEHLDIFNAKSLECKKEAVPTSTLLPVWEVAHKWELQQSVSHPNDNAFTEMIQWTKQGKLWTFPIDNEVGLEEEKSVGFHEHIFLEQHLEGWCPRRGPIRHFMELVCTGLSKNPHLTVERKQAHIQWYKNYFAEKEEILKEIGAIETSQ